MRKSRSPARVCLRPSLPHTNRLRETIKASDRFLGYVLRLGSVTLYHSGDTIAYEGLSERVLAHQVDLALLPINGRGKGVPGNFTLAEAIQLCHGARIPYLIPHHFGMFAFNTVDPEVIKVSAARITSPACLIPDPDTWWRMS